jgi:hypothetical protein
VPTELADVVARMMAKEPADRFQTPSEVAQALAPFTRNGARASGGLESRPDPPATTTEDRRQSRGVPSWVWPSVAAGVLALGLGAAWVVESLRPRVRERPLDADPSARAEADPKSPVQRPEKPAPPELEHPGEPEREDPVDRKRDARPSVVRTEPRRTPDQILTDNGLRRWGQMYVLDETKDPIASLLKTQAQMRQIEIQFDANRTDYAAIETDYQQVESDINALDQLAIALTALAQAEAAPELGEQQHPDKDKDEQHPDKDKDEQKERAREQKERAREQKERARDEAREKVKEAKERLSPELRGKLPEVDLLVWLELSKFQLQARLEEMSRRGQELIGQNVALFQQQKLLQADWVSWRDKALLLYKTLNADREITSALDKLNEGRAPGQRIVVAPVDDLTTLPAIVKLRAREFLLARGLDYKKGHPHFQHPTVWELRKAKEGVDTALRKLGDGRSPLEKLMEDKKHLEEELARASSKAQRDPLTYKLNVCKEQIARLEKSHGPDGAGTAAEPRGELVRAVVRLHRAADALQALYTGLQRDPEVRTALQEVGWGRKPIPEPPELAKGMKALEKAKPRVETKVVALRKDGDRHRVDATLNGRKVASLVVDPEGETVLTARLATEAGVTVVADEPIVQTVGGLLISARRATLPSVQLGGYTATDSPCLVLLEGDAGVEPRIGRAFLDRFGGTYDKATGTLVLGDVKPSASSPASPPPKKGSVPPQPPVVGPRGDRTGQPPGQARD